MKHGYPVKLFVDLDPQHAEGQRRARVVARVGHSPLDWSEHTLFSDVVYDYPTEGRGAEKLIMLCFAESLRRLTEREDVA